MDNKTKDALKQLQAEMRHLQTLVAEGHVEPKADRAAPDEDSGVKTKPDVLVQYAIHRPASGSAGAAIKTGTAAVSAAQIAKVSDEAVAVLGYALSSPQKVALLRALLDRTLESAAALGATTHLTTGSLYHHLRDLMHAGLMAQAGRNQYHITARGQRVLLLLTALASET